MTSPEEKAKPGAKPDHLKIEGKDWKQAVKRALEKEGPKEGWPKGEEPKRDE
ncbi:MAG: hypothetical protein GTN62_07025 [Gemmatimonadales bacterium]|nr:hypothetical protein [Gemmatimonadales bacterium]NIN11252.1 hypothetical protein [Gemmatimonadales bacterium]NIN49851.1 hypothetical protein [Gemmatimonadales bacterium]NIP07315.1 hypothetical protein [Gemmatimonadales bacterium]NIR03010.1 hypothetical protein [Gemmatimonadales bacterium]